MVTYKLHPILEEMDRLYWILHYLNEERNRNNSNIFEVSIKGFYNHLHNQKEFEEIFLNENTADFWEFENFLSWFYKKGYIKFFDREKNKTRTLIFSDDYLTKFKDWYIEIQGSFMEEFKKYKIPVKQLLGDDIKHGDISFNLQNRTLEIGILRNENKIVNIDKIQLSPKNLQKKTPIAITLLYCIVQEANKGNFIIKNSLYDYEKIIEEYRLGVGINSKTIQIDFATYLSSVRTLLESSQSQYEITTKTSKSSAIFGLKTISNKSS